MIQEDSGYLICDQIFARGEIESLGQELASANVERTKAGARHVLRVPAVRALSMDPRLMRIAGQCLGRPPIPFRATLFDKSPSANWLVVWHQDTALPICKRLDRSGWGPWSTKAGVLYAHAPAAALEQIVALRVSIDDSTATNGPLRVLPNTHRRGVLTDEQIATVVREVAAVDCVGPAGGVVVMRPLTIHASSKSVDGQPRRVLHLEYAATVSLGANVELMVG
jgi:ectoine hydroxylase-related dioxygenase (phytanoyl-CoA dioxygenase family)